MRNELVALLEKHCGTIRSEAENIDDCMREMGPNSGDEDIQKTIYLVHKIKGSAGALGFLPLSSTAHDLEYALRDLDEKPNRNDGLAEIQQLSALFQDEISQLDPVASALHQSAAMGKS